MPSKHPLRVTVFAVAVVAGDMEVLYGTFT